MNDNYGGCSAGAYDNAKCVKTDSPVSSAIDRNQVALARLHDQVSRLVNRIDAVLANPVPATDKAESRQAGVSALHESLVSHGEGLNELSRRLEDIINRVTI